MQVPKKFRRRWRHTTVRLYGSAICRWIVRGMKGLRPLWRDARYQILAVKLRDARSRPMREALGDKAATDLYNGLLRCFVTQGSSRRMVGGDRRSE